MKRRQTDPIACRSEHVHYIVSGTLAIIKNRGQPNELEVDVLGRGSCVGDWGVVRILQPSPARVFKADCCIVQVNEKPRAASCVTREEVEVLVVDGAVAVPLCSPPSAGLIYCACCSGANFQAVIDQSLLQAITNGDTGGGKFQPAQKSVGLDFGGDSTGSGKFKLISRRDRKRAGAVMVQATKKMSQEDRRLGISVLDYVPEMAE